MGLPIRRHILPVNSKRFRTPGIGRNDPGKNLRPGTRL